MSPVLTAADSCGLRVFAAHGKRDHEFAPQSPHLHSPIAARRANVGTAPFVSRTRKVERGGLSGPECTILGRTFRWLPGVSTDADYSASAHCGLPPLDAEGFCAGPRGRTGTVRSGTSLFVAREVPAARHPLSPAGPAAPPEGIPQRRGLGNGNRQR